MFVIFGVGPKEKIEATGMFVCPRCKVKKEYRVKSSVEYFRLFFIPIFPTGEKKEPYVECQSCQRTYYTDTLENNNYNLDGTPFKTAKGAFKKHPCTMWAADSPANCAWLIQHAMGLCSEFNKRYGKLHGLTSSLWEAKKLFHRIVEPIIVFRDVTGFARAMPEELKFDNTISDVQAYRQYLNTKDWVWYNYLRIPARRPDWVIQPQ